LAGTARSRLDRIGRSRQRLYNVLELVSGGGRLTTAVSWASIVLIAVTLAATVLETVPSLANAHSSLFEVIEYAALAAFSAEHLARLWTAAEYARWKRLGPVQCRLRFAFSPPGLIDLAAVLPFWLSFAVASGFKAFLVSSSRHDDIHPPWALLEALYAERRALLGYFVILCGVS